MRLDGLTQEQLAVVTHVSGPAVVIACPGSGKTRALTHRMGHLVQQCGVAPHAILGITFTRAAAGEMKERLTGLIAPDLARRVRLFTFHGLAWRILTDSRGALSVLDEGRQQAMIRQLLRDQSLNADQTAVENVLTDLARYVGAQIPRAHFAPGSLDPEIFFRLEGEYRRLKEETGVLDFDDLLVGARDLLGEFPERRAEQVDRIRHLMVDEFQDTNTLQWQFLQLLTPPGPNIMAVGDDDQAIYGWRGASPSFMLRFPQEFPGCRELHLSRNFRSTGSIVEPAERLIRQNQQRFAKAFETERAPAEAPIFTRPSSAAQEAEALVGAIQKHLSGGGNPAGAAVLYRASLLALPLMKRLDEAGIPYRVLGGKPNPFTRWMARDALAYLRWSWGEASLEEVLRVLRRPGRRSISKELLADLERSGTAPGAMLDWLEAKTLPAGRREVRALRAGLVRLREARAGEAISLIRTELDYERYITQYCDWSGSDPAEAREVLAALEQIPAPDEPSRVYLELAAQAEARQEQGESREPMLTLSSLHSSKGLEWERVWLISAVEGAIPHRYVVEAEDRGALEEERRLFYVGMTRAKDRLEISAPQYLAGAPASPSRFVIEAGIWAPPPPPPLKPKRQSLLAALTLKPAASPDLPPPLPVGDYAPGIICYHIKFGQGVIHRVDQRYGVVEVHFRGGADIKLLYMETCVSSGLLRQAR